MTLWFFGKKEFCLVDIRKWVWRCRRFLSDMSLIYTMISIVDICKYSQQNVYSFFTEPATPGSLNRTLEWANHIHRDANENHQPLIGCRFRWLVRSGCAVDNMNPASLKFRYKLELLDQQSPAWPSWLALRWYRSLNGMKVPIENGRRNYASFFK